jgi:hypothetical protein
MGWATVYCDRCGSQIAGVDFEKGRAIERSGKNFCPECAVVLPPPTPGDGKKKGGTTTTVKRSGEHPRDTDIIRNLSGLGGRANTTRIHLEPHAHPAAGMPAGTKIGLGVGGVAIVVVLALVLASSGGSKSGGGGGGDDPGARQKSAQEAVEKAEAARSGKPREYLELAERAERLASGTSLSGRAQAARAEAQALVEAEEKSGRIEEEARMVSREIAGAEDPASLDPIAAELSARARKVSEPLGQRVQEMLSGAKARGLVKLVGKVDLDFASTPHGFRNVNSRLDELAKAGATLGPQASALNEAVTKKRAEAKETFSKGAAAALAELERKVDTLTKSMRYADAERELNGFLEDYKGMEVAAKAEAIAAEFQKKKKALEDAWVVPKTSDWKADLKDARMTDNAGVLEFVHEGTPTATEDITRRIVFQPDDRTWRNMEVHFDVYIEKVGGMLLMHLAENNPVKVGFPEAKGGQGLTTGTWHHLELRLSGNTCVFGGVASGSFNCTPTSGGVGFVVYPGGKFKLRNIKARRLP